LGAYRRRRSGDDRKDIQKRLVHTSSKSTDIYIKEAVPDVSEIEWTCHGRSDLPPKMTKPTTVY
jgi:hypothetical protein